MCPTGHIGKFEMKPFSEDPAGGLRDFEKIRTVAGTAGLELDEDNAMPANNRLLVWRSPP
jgi:hypothetical protein